MNPEQLSDAMNELPQELLEETQAVRSRRRPRWKPLAAAAACLLLAAGAWALAGRPAEPAPDPEPGDLPVLTIDRDYSGMGDYPLSLVISEVLTGTRVFSFRTYTRPLASMGVTS